MNTAIEREAYLRALKEIYQKDLFAFAKHGLGYSDITQRTHRPITDILQSDTKKKLIVVPRGTFKSTICSVSYPIWLLINDPNQRILLDSELYTNSSRFLREICGHLESKHLTDVFGAFRGKDSLWRDGEIVINQRTKVHKEPSILCSGIGAQKTGMHFTTIVADDLSSIDNSMTKERAESVFNHYRLYISLLDPGGTLVVVGTRYSSRDIIGYIMESEVNKKGIV